MRSPSRPSIAESTEVKAHRVLRSIQPVPYINVFGHALVEQGVVQSQKAEYGMSNQGAALLAGRWLRRLEKAGLARNSPTRGWVAL